MWANANSADVDAPNVPVDPVPEEARPAMSPVRYPTDLTDEQWKILEPLIPPAKRGGRPRSVDMREIVNAILYVVRGGVAWRLLPKDFPGWSSTYHYFRRWRLCGVWKKIHDELHAQVREADERAATPSAAILDSQSVKTTEKGAPSAAMTRGKTSKDANDTRWSTRSD